MNNKALCKPGRYKGFKTGYMVYKRLSLAMIERDEDGVVLSSIAHPRASLFYRLKLWVWLWFNDPISDDSLETIEIDGFTVPEE